MHRLFALGILCVINSYASNLDIPQNVPLSYTVEEAPIVTSYDIAHMPEEPILSCPSSSESYSYYIRKHGIDIALGTLCGSGAVMAGSYIFEYIDQLPLKPRSKYIAMTSFGTLFSGVAYIFAQGGGEVLCNNIYQITGIHTQGKPEEGYSEGVTPGQNGYSLSFALAYGATVVATLGIERLLKG